jgi:negative regulator of sigma-B (phosphoserine phosphatase)
MQREPVEILMLAVEHLTLPKDGERECGDAVVVRVLETGTLIAVVDALGHGPKAAAVTHAAVTWLADAALDDGAARVLERLHAHLLGGRGAAALVAIIRGLHLEGSGVGNVDMRVCGAKVPVVLSRGVLGRSIHHPFTFRGELVPGARVVIFTDGIASRLDLVAVAHLDAKSACRALMDRHRRGYDDAAILVADVSAFGLDDVEPDPGSVPAD